MDWQLEGACRLRISSQREPAALTLEVEQAPDSASAAELANILVLMSSALSRVEENPQVEAHLRGASRTPRKGWMDNWGRGSLMGLGVFVLGVGAGLPLSGCMGHAASGLAFTPLAQTGWSYLDHMAELHSDAVSYPMPSKPLELQATAPCRTKRDEVEINGGCWMELARRPPCIEETQAEYQGKCYMPVVKPSRPLRSVQP